MRQLPKALRQDVYRCADCGSTSVEHTHWVDLNSGVPGEVFGSWCQPDGCWCSSCERPPSSIEVTTVPIGLLGLLARVDFLRIEVEKGAGMLEGALIHARDGTRLLLMAHSARAEIRCIVMPEDDEIEKLEHGNLADLWRSERSHELAGVT